MLLHRVVTLHEHVELEALRGVPDLLLAEDHDAAIEILARDLGLELLDTAEVLLVERADPVELLFKLSDACL
jgi:hypothetical protein